MEGFKFTTEEKAKDALKLVTRDVLLQNIFDVSL